MDEYQILTRRLLARATRRAVPLHESRDLSPDPPICIGIATIKIVTEEHVQALAYGDFKRAPDVVARIDPLGRDASDLEAFANWLIAQCDRALTVEALIRFWIPHGKTLETLDVLGHRYERNAAATATLQRMGQICRVLAREARHEGQQAVAIASDLLRRHVATGQSAAEDGHLGALLAWINPPRGRDPGEVAIERSIEPASGVLANHPARKDDEQVEILRRRWKAAAGDEKRRLEQRISKILSRGALDEWALLVEARRAFWTLPLTTVDLGDCIDLSRERILFGLAQGPRVPKNPVPRIRDMMELENSQASIKRALLANDAVVRSRARAKGRCLLGSIVSVVQPRPSFHPCSIDVATDQLDLRLRIDDELSALGTNVSAKVRNVVVAPSRRGSIVTLEIMSGVRSVGGLVARGMAIEWLDRGGFPLYVKRKALAAATVPWMLVNDGNGPPRVAPVRIAGDLLAVAERHLGGGRRVGR